MSSRPVALALLAVAGSGAVGVAQAQTTLSVGILGGATIGKIHNPNPDNVFTKSWVGFMAGGALTVGLSPYFAIEPEVLFVQKGAKAEEAEGTGSIKVSYVQVPLFAKVRIPPKGKAKVSPHLYAGPAIAFKASCKARFTVSGTTVSGTCGEGDFADVKLKSTDFGLVGGAGLEISHAMIGVRYDLGLSKLGDTGDPTEDNVKSRTLSILGGVSFPIRVHRK